MKPLGDGISRQINFLLPRLAPWLVGATTCAVFLPVLRCGLTWDDRALLVSNPMWRGLSLDHLRWMFTSVYMGHYMPLTWLSYALEYRLWGLNPVGYHAVNGLIHAVNAVLVYFLAKQLLGRLWGQEDARIPACAAVGALLFSLHPLRVESVAWVTQRRDVLASLFLLVTVNSYVKASDQGTKRPGLYLGIAWAAYVVSLLAKSLGMLLPAVLVILDVYPLRRLPGDTRAWFQREHWKVWVEKVLFLIPAVGAMFMATIAQSLAGAAVTTADHNFVARAAQASYGVFFYPLKTIWPAGLYPLHEIPEDFFPYSFFYLACFMAALALTFVFIRIRGRWPGVLAAWGCYVILFLPTSGFLQSGPQLVADRYTYLSMLGAALLVSGGVAAAWRRWPGARLWIGGGPVLALALLSVITWRQCDVWRNEWNFWRRVMENEPSSTIANSNFGLVLLKQGHAEEALAHFRRVLTSRSNSSSAIAHHNAGLANEKLGRFPQAIFHQKMTIYLAPDMPMGYASLGSLYLRTGQPAKAAAAYEKALSINPNSPQVHERLAEARMKMRPSP